MEKDSYTLEPLQKTDAVVENPGNKYVLETEHSGVNNEKLIEREKAIARLEQTITTTRATLNTTREGLGLTPSNEDPPSILQINKKLTDLQKVDAEENAQQVLDTIKESEILKENFNYIVSEEEAETLANEKLAPFLMEKLVIPVGKLDQFEENYTQDNTNNPYGYSQSERNEYSNYWDLRCMDFSRSEIENFIKTAESGEENLAQELLLLLGKERGKIASLSGNPERKLKIRSVFSEINTLYQEAGVSIPRSKLPTTQFIGKFDQIFLQLKRGQQPGISLGKGEYFPEFDACAVQLNPASELEITDLDITIAAHENFHGLSAKKICSGENGNVSWSEAIKGKSGFFTKNKGNERRPHSLLALNEGVTELFARVVASKGGIDVLPAGSYNNYVKDALVLAQVLNGENVNELLPYKDIKPVLLKSLLEKYGSETGTLALGREMDRKLGPKALVMFDMFSSSEIEGGFVTFVKSIQAMRAGLPAEEIIVDLDLLQRYGLSLEESKKDYPFLIEKSYEQ